MAEDGVEQRGQQQLKRLETTRICNSCSVVLIEMISTESGNGSNGVVGIPLQLLLKFDGKSVARLLRIYQRLTKKVHEPDQ